MNWNQDPSTLHTPRAQTLSSFATQVYSWLAMGLSLTSVITFAIYNMGWYEPLMPFWMVWTFALFGITYVMGSRMRSLSFGQTAALFFTYAAIEGIFFGTVIPLFIAKSGVETVWLAFAGAAVCSFIAVAYGSMTQADLTAMRNLLTLGLYGLIAITFLCLILSFFMPTTGMQLIIAYVGLALFLGLAASDAQQIQRMSRQIELERDSAPKLSLFVALGMYINVVMVFWYLLQILSANSSRRND